jgi:hypothetical protein
LKGLVRRAATERIDADRLAVDRPPPPEALGSLLTHSAPPCCTCAQVPKWGTTENNLLWVARIFHVPMTLMACLVAAWAYNPAYLLVVAFGEWKRWHVAHADACERRATQSGSGLHRLAIRWHPAWPFNCHPCPTPADIVLAGCFVPLIAAVHYPAGSPNAGGFDALTPVLKG